MKDNLKNKVTIYHTDEWYTPNNLCSWSKHDVWKSLDNTEENHQKLLDEIEEEYSEGNFKRGHEQYLHIKFENETGDFAQKSHSEQQRTYDENFR